MLQRAKGRAVADPRDDRAGCGFTEVGTERNRGVRLAATAVQRMRRGQIAFGDGFDKAGGIHHGRSDAIAGFFAYGYGFHRGFHGEGQRKLFACRQRIC